MVLRSDRLGDLVLCSGYLHNLVESWSADQVDLWVAPDMLPVQGILHPKLSVCPLPFDRYLRVEDQVIRDWLRHVEDQRYDQIVIPQFTLGYPEVLALEHLSIARRWGFANCELGVNPGWVALHVGAPPRDRTAWITNGPQVKPFSHECTKYEALATSQGLIAGRSRPQLSVPDLARILKTSDLLVWPGCGSEARRWPLRRFSETISQLGLARVTVGTVPSEAGLAQELLDLLGEARIAADIEIRQPAELAATAIWVAGFRRILTNDTGIAHLGAACGCAVTAISHSQHQGRFTVFGDSGLTIFADVPCARCSALCLFDDPLWPCVSEIDAERAAQAIREFKGGHESVFLPPRSFPLDSGFFGRLHSAKQHQSAAREAKELELARTIRGLRDALRGTEAQRDRWEGLFRNAEIQADRLRAMLSEAEKGCSHWRSLCGEAEDQRGHWRSLCGEAEDQRDTFKKLLAEAEDQRGHWRSLCGKAEDQRDTFKKLLAEAEDQRGHWRSLCGEAEDQRDTFKKLLAEAEDQRGHWESLYHESESRSDQISGRLAGAELQSKEWESRCREFYELFPWADRSPLPDMVRQCPKISIITPSFQQGRFIEENIRSVLDQGYPNFEHVIVDAGSTDQTLPILKKYAHLRWISEPDLGQTHAINKGILMSSGDIVAYLNSDDAYRPGAFHAVARIFQDNPAARMLVGDCDYINEASETIGHLRARYEQYEDLVRYWGWDKWYCLPQQSVFLRRDLLSEVGLFDIQYHMVMDYEMWLRIAQITKPHLIPQTLAAFRLAAETKTVSRTHVMYAEELHASRRYWRLLPRHRRIVVALQAHQHASKKLLDMAEHFAFSSQPALAAELALDSVSKWPATVFAPRLLFTVLQLGAAPLPRVCAGVRRMHRKYLGLQWKLRQRAAQGRET
jgi:glycosyltransferase involved in cell wall biosynthesis/ADP-heptose:LPS heptosyltransferase